MRALTFAVAALAVMSLPAQGLGGVNIAAPRGQPTPPAVGHGARSPIHPADLHRFARKRRRAAQGKRGKR